MERFTMSLEDELANQFDDYIERKAYSNRSEALRDLIRKELESERLDRQESGHCIATLTYIYNHHESELASRITSVQHDHHDLTMSSMHVHLDHDNCLEVTILRGPTKRVREFANAIIASRGVRHGNVHMIPVTMNETKHGNDGSTHVHSHPVT